MRRTRSEAISTYLRARRSAMTPATSRKTTRESDRLASTNPSPAGERSIDRTANGRATGTRPSPKSEKARATYSRRKSGSPRAPRLRIDRHLRQNRSTLRQHRGPSRDGAWRFVLDYFTTSRSSRSWDRSRDGGAWTSARRVRTRCEWSVNPRSAASRERFLSPAASRSNALLTRRRLR